MWTDLGVSYKLKQNQKEEKFNYTDAYMWNLENNTDNPIFKAENKGHRYRKINV